MKTNDEIKNSGLQEPMSPDSPAEDILKSEEAELYDYGPESRSERISNNAVKGSVWLLGIVAVFALAILIAWLVGMNDSPLSSRSEARAETALTQPQQPLNPSLSAGTASSPAGFMAILVRSDQSPSGAQASLAGASGKAAVSSASASSSDAARIEEEAREVIHGDFGDNPGRKAKLGADYSAVQARVNQILQQ